MDRQEKVLWSSSNFQGRIQRITIEFGTFFNAIEQP